MVGSRGGCQSKTGRHTTYHYPGIWSTQLHAHPALYPSGGKRSMGYQRVHDEHAQSQIRQKIRMKDMGVFIGTWHPLLVRLPIGMLIMARSEERRVGKECRKRSLVIA